MRPFFSSSRAPDSARDLERRVLGMDANRPEEEDSPLSSVIRELPGRSNLVKDQYYRKLAEGLESEIISTPYADRTPPYHIHVYSHKHNTILTLTRPNGDPMLSMGCGRLGFRKSHRQGYDPAYQLTSHVFAHVQENGWLMNIDRLEVVFRGFGPGREAFTKVLLGNEGTNIRQRVCRVSDSTRIKFGGTRSRRVRRLG